MFKLSKEFHFSAAHALTHLPSDHKCHRQHGHNYKVVLVLQSSSLDGRGFAGFDYAELDKFGNWLKYTFDHRNLNDSFVAKHTTAEFLASMFYEKASQMFGEENVCEIRVHETPSTCVVYSGP